MIEIILFAIAVFFSLNMGAPSFAGSFATAVGSKALSRVKAAALFLIFATLGAVFFGGAVSKTISKGIVPANLIDMNVALIILFSATASLFVANIMKVPQSTSLSTIASICGVGTFLGSVAWDKIGHMAVWWTIMTAVAFIMVFSMTQYVYPPRKRNFWLYEKVLNNQERLTWLAIITSCYQAFGQGSNNVANAVGPLISAGVIDLGWGLLLMGIVFGIGALTFTGPMNTASEKIVPLGLLTATIINLVTGTMSIIASKMGLPLPAVIVYTVSILAIGSIKDGLGATTRSPLTRKTFFTWTVNPFVTFCLSFILANIFLHK